jgi:hypothetical protein
MFHLLAATVLLAAEGKRPTKFPLTSLAHNAHFRSVINSWGDFVGANTADPVIQPVNYGADPTGKTDSTNAFLQAVAAVLASNTSGHV